MALQVKGIYYFVFSYNLRIIGRFSNSILNMDWRHNRPFRILLLLCTALIVLAGVVPYFVPMDMIHSELQSRLARDTQRNLVVHGGTRFVLLPRPALLLGEASLSEPSSQTIFARFKHAKLSLAIWPLLTRGEFVLRELELDKPELSVLRREDGSLNFEDLLAQGDERRQLHFGLEELHFNDAELRFSDEFLGNTLSMAQLDLALENLADPKNGRLMASGGVVLGQKGQPADWQGMLKASAAMRYNKDERRLLIANLKLDLQQSGQTAAPVRISQAQLSVTGNLIYGWQPLRLSGGDLKLAGEMMRASQKWKLNLDLPEIRVTDSKLSLNRLLLAATMQSDHGSFSSKVDVPALAAVGPGFLRADAAKIDVKINSPEQNLALAFASPLELRAQGQAVLNGYSVAGSYGNRNLPRGAIPFDLQGEGLLDVRQELVQLTSHGSVDHSPVDAQLQLNDFVSPRYRVKLDLARLDLSPYLPAVAANAKNLDPDEPFDLWWLTGLTAEGSIRVGELVLQKLHINDLSFNLMADQHKLVLDPLSATVYEGQLTGRAEVDASRNAPVFHLQQRLSNMNINPLLIDALATNRFEGRGFLDLDVAAVGRKVSDLRRTAGGNVRLQLSKGSIRGLDVEAVLRATANQIKALNGESKTQAAEVNARTRFSELNASLVLKHGVATNNDLAMTAGVLQLSGAGAIDFGAGSLDYTLNASANPKVPELSDLAGLTLPIQLVGSLASPEYRIDYASLKEQLLARKKVEAKTRTRKKQPKAPAKRKPVAKSK